MAVAVAADATNIADSPTITQMPTECGVLLGTAAYMSPEQVKGGPVDRRADIWAFGCVLYEMLTAKKAFPADTVPETLAAILHMSPTRCSYRPGRRYASASYCSAACKRIRNNDYATSATRASRSMKFSPVRQTRAGWYSSSPCNAVAQCFALGRCPVAVRHVGISSLRSLSRKATRRRGADPLPDRIARKD